MKVQITGIKAGSSNRIAKVVSAYSYLKLPWNSLTKSYGIQGPTLCLVLSCDDWHTRRTTLNNLLKESHSYYHRSNRKRSCNVDPYRATYFNSCLSSAIVPCYGPLGPFSFSSHAICSWRMAGDYEDTSG